VELAVKKKNTKLDDPDQIKKYLISNITTSDITLNVTKSSEVIVISFYSSDTKTGVEVISQISQLLERQILDLSINQNTESIYFKASL
jgi:thioredoxin-like negative regulator of GroEL